MPYYSDGRMDRFISALVDKSLGLPNTPVPQSGGQWFSIDDTFTPFWLCAHPKLIREALQLAAQMDIEHTWLRFWTYQESIEVRYQRITFYRPTAKRNSGQPSKKTITLGQWLEWQERIARRPKWLQWLLGS